MVPAGPIPIWLLVRLAASEEIAGGFRVRPRKNSVTGRAWSAQAVPMKGLKAITEHTNINNFGTNPHIVRVSLMRLAKSLLSPALANRREQTSIKWEIVHFGRVESCEVNNL